jgi:TPP-dependent 2-oxoacid decarboxylase
MTAQEIGTFSRFGSNAVVVVVNNDGYVVERYLSPIIHACERARCVDTLHCFQVKAVRYAFRSGPAALHGPHAVCSVTL